MILRIALLLSLLVSGCVIGGDRHPRPRDLDPSWLVSRVRVLAVRPEPPEIQPGETVTFEALIADPEGVVESVVWLLCEDATGFGCATDLTDLSADATPDELAEAGVIGLEPFFPPEWTAPEDLLDGLDEAEAREGVQVTAQLFAVPDLEDLEEALDFSEVEAAFKRVVVSEALTPNENPVLDSWTIEDETVPAGATVEVEPGETYQIGVWIDEDSIQTYLHVNAAGEIEERVERPYVAWYTTGGTIGDPHTLYPYFRTRWRAPSEAGAEGVWYAVVRDRRGGQDWLERRWRVRP